MTDSPTNTALLAEDRIQWQLIADYLESRQFPASMVDNIERLSIASRYAMAQLQRNPEWIDHLLELKGSQLEAHIIQLDEGEKIDLDQVKRSLRQYRHRKLVEIIYLDTVLEQPLEATLLQQSELADQLILAALDICQRQLSENTASRWRRTAMPWH